MNSCEAIGCPGHEALTPAEKKRAAKIDGVMREILENQLAIMRALRYMQEIPGKALEHLEERAKITREMLEEKP